MSESFSSENFEQKPQNTPEILNKEDELKKSGELFLGYLRIEDLPEESDCIFILGGSSIAPVQRAAELYQEGYSKNIAFISTGGKFGGDKIWNMPENEMYKKILLELGIPENSIISEGKTANTLEEAKAAIPFLEERGIDPKKIILVARPFHQRRAFATFEKQYPEVKYINCPAKEPLDLEDLETQERLVQEAERILDYQKKGDVKKQELPKEVIKAAAKLRRDLKKRGEYHFRNKPIK